jgi:hypothetical protein
MELDPSYFCLLFPRPYAGCGLETRARDFAIVSKAWSWLALLASYSEELPIPVRQWSVKGRKMLGATLRQKD